MIVISKVGVYHNYLCEKIKKRSNNPLEKTLIIKRYDFKNFLGWFNVPARLQNDFIKEMEEMNLVKTKDKQNILIVKRKKEDNWFD